VGAKSSHILFDREWDTSAFGENVFIYNLLRNEILEYDPKILRQHVRPLTPDEFFLDADLISNYWAARAIYRRKNNPEEFQDEEGFSLEPKQVLPTKEQMRDNLTAEEKELLAQEFKEHIEWRRKQERERKYLPFGSDNAKYESLIEQGLLTREEDKPEWLRGISGSGPTERAAWGPADKDGNPMPLGG